MAHNGEDPCSFSRVTAVPHLRLQYTILNYLGMQAVSLSQHEDA